MTTATFECWLVIDEGGDYAVGAGREEALESYADTIGCGDEVAKRVVLVPVTAALPRVVEMPAVTAPDEE